MPIFYPLFGFYLILGMIDILSISALIKNSLKKVPKLSFMDFEY